MCVSRAEEELAYDDSKEQVDTIYKVKEVTQSFQIVRWKIGNWSKLDKKVYSENFDVGGHPW